MRRRLFIVAALLAVASPAWAIDFTTPLHAIGGVPFKNEKGEPIELLLGTAAETALLAGDPADRDGNDKVKSFWLAVKLHEKNSERFSKEVTLSAEEIARIKDKIGKIYPPGVVGAAWAALDPASIPK